MFPDHCKEVSVRRVDFQLTAEEIKKNLIGKKAYNRTVFFALNNDDDWAVVRIEKDQGDGLFGTITEIEVISLPGSTMFCEDGRINVLNPTLMAEKADTLGCETLIVKGKFEHVSFIHKEYLHSIYVYEVVPPEPAKLIELAQWAIDFGNVKRPVRIIPKILDLTELARGSDKDIIVFPCQASHLKDERKTLYLDELPEISQQDLQKVALIGCDLSFRIFKEHYDFEPEFHNFCPRKLAMDGDPANMILTKCCQVKEGHENSDNMGTVAWGATQREVEDAINDLLR